MKILSKIITAVSGILGDLPTALYLLVNNFWYLIVIIMGLYFVATTLI